MTIGGSNLTGTAQTFTDTGKSVSDGTWHTVMVAITFGQGIQFTIDGTPSSYFAANIQASSAAAPFTIAAAPGYSGSAPLNGTIDDVLVQ